MSAKLDSNLVKTSNDLPIIIVGNGPVGVRAANLIIAKNPNIELVIFGEETNKPYNRVQLSYFLSGKVDGTQLDNPLVLAENSQVSQFLGRRIVALDRSAKTITDQLGNRFRYKKLILSLGSRPNIPFIENAQIQGVHQFRTFKDAQIINETKNSCKDFYIIGSGPLGLETAIALKTPNNRVTIQVRNNLFCSQFEENAQLVLIDHLQALGIVVRIHDPIKKLIGDEKIQAIEFSSGDILPADCLIFCSGILPNIELAKSFGLHTNLGIVVDDFTRTNDQDIYAIGECSEYHNRTFGLVKPGLKQAYICVEHIFGGETRLEEERPNLQVKLGSFSTAIYGVIGAHECEYFEYSNRLKGIFRKIALDRGKLIGAIVVGSWKEEFEVEKLVKTQARIKPKQLKTFKKSGSLCGNNIEFSLRDQSPDYLVCLCRNVTKGELSNAVESGCRTVELLGENTGAGTVCGSCQPLLSEFLDTPAPNLVMRHQSAILIASLVSILLIIVTLAFEPLEIASSVQLKWHFEKLWFDSFWKQVSGFTLLALCLIASSLALRKRWKKITSGHIDTWRYVHSIIGIIALVVLLIHTGVRLGNNLNFALMIVFLSATLTGSLVGVFMAKNHHWSDLKLRQHRAWWSRIHHTLLWMLPPLIGFHILSAYYF